MTSSAFYFDAEVRRTAATAAAGAGMNHRLVTLSTYDKVKPWYYGCCLWWMAAATTKRQLCVMLPLMLFQTVETVDDKSSG